MKNKTFKWIILGILLLFVFLFFLGLNREWFSSNNVIIVNQTGSGGGAGGTGEITYKTCNNLCESQDYDYGYNKINDCLNNEVYVEYGYPREIPLLKCCCGFNPISEPEPEPYDCTDSDGKNNFFSSGNCQDSFHQLGFSDYCEGNTAYDYYCDSIGICQKTYRSTPCYCYGGSCLGCALIQKPTGQGNCDLGICETGSCNYVPPTTTAISRCECA